MTKDKIFLVAPNVDTSIERFCQSYEIKIFPDFTSFEQYTEEVPDTVTNIIVTESVLPFVSSNMQRLYDATHTPFVRLSGRVIYLYGPDTSRDAVKKWTDSVDNFDIVTYQGDLSDQYIIGIINGKLRDSDEEKMEEVTYRYRASEYAEDQKMKRYDTDNNSDYQTDDEELAGIPDVEEPELYTPVNDLPTTEYVIVGKPSQARTMLAFIEAQYLAMKSKTLIIESDVNYHRLTDMVLKSGADYEFFDVADVYTNISTVISKIKMSKSNLIVVGATKRMDFSYDFLRDVLSDTLQFYVKNLVIEADFSRTPYSANYTIVFDDTMPDLLEAIDSMIYPVDPEKNVFVGVRQNNWQEYNMTTQELHDIICELLGMDEIVAQTITLKGSVIKKENTVYDLLSIIGRGNRR